MQINLTGHNVEITPALRTLTTEKLNRIEKHFGQITAINVVFDIEKKTQIAKATLLMAKTEIHARAESHDLYTAIDELIHKLDRQLVDHKKKLQDHH
jgi:putative sigma-54 modulation protein